MPPSRASRGPPPARALAALLLLAAASAGCSSDPPAAPGTPAPDAPLPALGVAYLCPEGAGRETRPGVCAASIAAAGASLQEPAAAAHPREPGTLALVANSVPLAAAADPMKGVRVLSVLDAFFTQDGGATWRRVEVPYPPRAPADLGATLAYDPTLVFAPDGTLHVAGIAAHDAGVAGALGSTRVFHVATRDLGATWSAPAWVGETGADRPWIGADAGGNLSLVWVEGRDTLRVASRPHDAAEWTMRGGEPESCGFASLLRREGDGLVFACGADAFRAARLLALAPGAAAPARVADLALPTPGLLHLAAREGADVVATLDGFAGEALWLRSRDAGATWTSLDLMQAAEPARAWATHRVFAVERDERGATHVILVGGADLARCDPAGGALVRKTPGGCQVVHAVVSPEGALVQATLLSPEGPPADPASAAAAFTGDDYATLLFHEGRGFAAWGSDGRILHTRLVPRDAT